MKKVIVTGASGFIGRHVLNPLVERGYQVFALSSEERNPNFLGVIWKQVDLFDSKAVEAVCRAVQADVLLHLAWRTTPGVFWSSPENFRWIEVSLQLFRFFIEAGGRRIISAGTCTEYDGSYSVCNEETPCQPSTTYGVCKAALHSLLMAMKKELGISYVWGRIFQVYGPGEHFQRFVPTLIQGILKGEKNSFSHGRQVRDFIFVKEAAELFVHLLDSDQEGVFNIGSGSGVSLRELAALAFQKIGGETYCRFDERPVSSFESPVLIADMSKAKDLLNWVPKINLEEGLGLCIQEWRRELCLL